MDTGDTEDIPKPAGTVKLGPATPAQDGGGGLGDPAANTLPILQGQEARGEGHVPGQRMYVWVNTWEN